MEAANSSETLMSTRVRIVLPERTVFYSHSRVNLKPYNKSFSCMISWSHIKNYVSVASKDSWVLLLVMTKKDSENCSGIFQYTHLKFSQVWLYFLLHTTLAEGNPATKSTHRQNPTECQYVLITNSQVTLIHYYTFNLSNDLLTTSFYNL